MTLGKSVLIQHLTTTKQPIVTHIIISINRRLTTSKQRNTHNDKYTCEVTIGLKIQARTSQHIENPTVTHTGDFWIDSVMVSRNVQARS